MNLLTLITSLSLFILTLWTAYHIPIVIAGVRRRLPKKDFSLFKRVKLKRYPKFSIIVPVKDEKAVIARCIEALLRQNYPEDKMEIIIVDGGSKDGTKKICETYAARKPNIIKILNQTEPKGKPSALNEALKHANGEIIGVFDADSVPRSDVLLRTAKIFENSSIKALQGRTASINRSESLLTRLAANEEKVWFQTLVAGREALDLFVPLTGSCQFVRYETLISMGGWRENSLAEDADLALRLIAMGHHVKYNSDVESWQETPSSLKGLIRQRVRWYMGYIENLLRYGGLIKNPNKRVIDAEFTLLGPVMMILSFITYWASFLHWMLIGEMQLPYAASIILTTLILLLIGLSLIFTNETFKVTDLVWIPTLYFYWLLQAVIAFWALIQLIFMKRRSWSKTLKSGAVTEQLFNA